MKNSRGESAMLFAYVWNGKKLLGILMKDFIHLNCEETLEKMMMMMTVVISMTYISIFNSVI